MKNITNRTVFCRDNIEILRCIDSESVDLIYLDPPFNKNKDFHAPIGSIAEGASFRDTWYAGDIKEEWLGLIADELPILHNFLQGISALGDKSNKYYLIYMAVRLLELKRILKSTGSIYLHCDNTMSHFIKLLMDCIFGSENYRNEIIWQRASGRAKGSQFASRNFGRDTDAIFRYSKTNNFYFQLPIQQTSQHKIEKFFPFVEEDGRRYHTRVPLFCQPSMGERPNLCYVYNGVENPYPSGWRVSKETLAEMDKKGEIIWRDGKRPLRKTYMDDYLGKPIGALWSDIPNVMGKERVGYPTQKPLALLERIILASSKEGDLILDPFCGCATTLIAAEKLNRQWIGIDISPKAFDLVKMRLKKDVADAEDLLKRQNTLVFRTDIPMRSDLITSPLKKDELKRKLYGRQEGNCRGCTRHFEYRNLTIDHILPKAKGGQDNLENLQLLCGSCNSIKGQQEMSYLMGKLREYKILNF